MIEKISNIYILIFYIQVHFNSFPKLTVPETLGGPSVIFLLNEWVIKYVNSIWDYNSKPKHWF